MTLAEHDAKMESLGTPKVWVVEHGWSGGNIHTDLFQTEEQAAKAYDDLPTNWYKNMYRTWDIWGWLKRQCD